VIDPRDEHTAENPDLARRDTVRQLFMSVRPRDERSITVKLKGRTLIRAGNAYRVLWLASSQAKTFPMGGASRSQFHFQAPGWASSRL
jgi:hypothetical protein